MTSVLDELQVANFIGYIIPSFYSLYLKKFFMLNGVHIDLINLEEKRKCVMAYRA